ncbi:CIPK10 [Symbiodinium pilosum]|uniref:CIPK10 protein n=1 Tax=Symbiodinium pilosum TaxID=2952 RepID=A0A812XN52_SYMPI|nr:CIPK10 [Symbiodinium pilosum]
MLLEQGNASQGGLRNECRFGVQVTADVLAYNALLGAFASEADFESAFKLIKDMESGTLRDVAPDASSYAAVANAACACSSSRRQRHYFMGVAEELVDQSREAMVEVDAAAYQRLLRHSARQGDAERVGRLLRRMSCLEASPRPSALLEALQACSTAPFVGFAHNLATSKGACAERTAFLLARPLAELGDWRGVQRLLGRSQDSATAAGAILQLMALAEAVPRKRRLSMEAAADFMRAGGRLSAEYSDCRDVSLGSLSAAAVLLRRSLGGRTVPGRRRGAAAEEKRRSEDRGRPSPQQKYRESAEERGLAAAARLAAAVAAATSNCQGPQAPPGPGDRFRLRRHSAIGCCRTAPGQPTPAVRQAWKSEKEEKELKELEKRERDRAPARERCEARPRVAPGEVAPRAFETSPRPRLTRAQSARRPTRPSAPERARSADPRRRQEGGFVPERREACAVASQTFPLPLACSMRLHGEARGTSSQQQLLPWLDVGYSVAKFLGRGASASVWEAVRSDNEQRVAVKVFDQGQRDKRQAHREMKVLSRVRHPRIVEAFEVIETPRYAQLVCELVDGESLRAFSHRQPCHKLSEQAARHYYRQVVEGVSVCHDRLVAHRDLKLENVLLDKGREGVKIIDFGFAAHVPSKETKLKAFCGTPSYMAPEIIRGEGYSGFAADVWALGVVLFALLSGTLPFSAKTEMQLYARIRRGTFSFPDCLGEAQKRLIRGVMRKDAAVRPSASALLQHAWVAGRDADADPGRDVWHMNSQKG